MRTKTGYRDAKKYAWFTVVIILLFTSCVNYKRTTMLKEDNRNLKEFNIENPRGTTYRIQTGDQLYIKIHSLDPKTARFFQSDLPSLMNPTYLYLNSYTVDEEGFISFSFIEKLHVQGKTLPETQKYVQDVLKGYFTEINVVLKLVDFQVSVIGEVSSPGTYSINREYANVLQAISLAGGASDVADINRVKLIRQTPTGSEVKVINLGEMDLLAQDYYHLQPNDILYLNPRPIKTFRYKEFPYSLLLSVASTGILIYTIFLK